MDASGLHSMSDPPPFESSFDKWKKEDVARLGEIRADADRQANKLSEEKAVEEYGRLTKKGQTMPGLDEKEKVFRAALAKKIGLDAS